MDRNLPPERHDDELITGGSPAQERARRAEHEQEERAEKERERGEESTSPPRAPDEGAKR